MSAFQTIEIVWPDGRVESHAVRGESADQALAKIGSWPEFSGATFTYRGPADGITEQDETAATDDDYEWLPFTLEWDDHSAVCDADAY